MREADLCREILHHAYSSKSSFSLLHVLSSYDHILALYSLPPDSLQATNAYRRLLRWGRDLKTDWWDKFDRDFSEKPAPISPSANQIPGIVLSPTTASPHLSLTVSPKSLKGGILGEFLPQREKSLAEFQLSLPKLGEFLNRGKKDRKMAAKALRGLRRYITDKQHTEICIKTTKEKIEKRKKSTFWREWREKSVSKIRKSAGKSHYKHRSMYRSFHKWSQFLLIQVKFRLFSTLAIAFRNQIYITNWKKAVEIHKMRNGLKFTAEFLHSQWLRKKSLIGFGRKLQHSLRLAIFSEKTQQNASKWLKKRSFKGLKTWVNDKNSSKTMIERGCKARHKLRLKYALRRMRFGVRIMSEYKELLRIASEFESKQSQMKGFRAAFRAFRDVLTRKAKRIAAQNHSKLRQTRNLFEFLHNSAYHSKSFAISSIRKLKAMIATRIFTAWKLKTRLLAQFAHNFSLVYCAYAWLTLFTISRQLVFSPFSTAGLSTNRSTIATYQLPLAFENHAGKPRNKATNVADATLKRYFSTKIYKTWKDLAVIFHQKRKISKSRKIACLFSVWKTGFEARSWLKYRFSRYIGKKRKQKSELLFSNWRIFAYSRSNTKFAYNKLKSANEFEEITRIWTIWRRQFRFIQRRTTEKRICEAQIKGRFLSKPFSVWRKRFDFRMKKKHLCHTGEKFAFQRVILSGWNVWRKRFVAAREMVISCEKHRKTTQLTLLNKIVTVWLQSIPSFRIKSTLRRTADSAYYHSGKSKGISRLKSYLNRANYLRHRYEVAETHCKRSTKQRYLSAIFKFVARRVAITSHDAAVLPQIHRFLTSNLFHKWRSAANLFSNVRYLPTLLTRLQQGLAIRRLRMTAAANRLIAETLRFEQESTLKSDVFSAWRQFIRKKAALQTFEVEFRLKSRYYRRLVPFKTWQRALRFERNVWNLYCSAVIRIKNDILQKCVRGWQHYTAYTVRKKNCISHRDVTLSRSCVIAWRHFVVKRETLARLQQTVERQKTKGIVRRTFYTWVAEAIRIQRRWYYYLEVSKAWKRKTFAMWKTAAKWKSRANQAFDAMRQLMTSLRKKTAISKLLSNATQRKVYAENRIIAQFHYANRLSKRSFTRLIAHRNKEKKCTQCQSVIISTKSVRILTSFFNNWKVAAAPAIKRVQSALSLLTTFRHSVERIAVSNWSQSVDRIKSVDRWADNVRNRKLKGTAVECLLVYLRSRRDKTARLETAKMMEKRLWATQALTRLQNYCIIRKMVGALGKKGKTHYRSKKLREIIVIWQQFVTECEEMNKKADRFFGKKRGVPMIKAWKIASERLKAIKSVQKTVENRSILSILRKSIRSMRFFTELSKEKKIEFLKSEKVYLRNIQKRYFTLFSLSVETRKAHKALRARFSLKFQRIYERILTHSVFSSLKDHYQFKLSQASAFHQQCAFSSLKPVLAAMRFLIEKRKYETEISQLIGKTVRKHSKMAFLSAWRRSRIVHFSLKKLKFRLKRKVQIGYLHKWQFQLSLKYVFLRKDFTRKRTAFHSLRIHAESSVLAQVILSRVNASLEIDLQSRIFHKWDRFRREHRKIESIVLHQRLIRQYKVFTQWEKAMLIRRGTAIMQSEHGKRLQIRIIRAWRGELMRKYAVWRQFSTVLRLSQIRNKREAVEKWLKVAYKRCLYERIYTEIIEPGRWKKASTALLAWKYEVQMKRLLIRIYTRYQHGKALHRKWVLFQAFVQTRNHRIASESVSLERKRHSESQAKRRIFRKWAGFVSKKTTISALQSVVFRNNQRSRLYLFLSIWVGKVRKISSIADMKERHKAEKVKRCYFAWRQRFIDRSHTGIIAKLVQLCTKAIEATAVREWQSAVNELTEIDTKVEIFLATKAKKQQKRALFNLKFAMSRHQTHASAALRLNFNHKKRAFRLLVLGCRLSTKATLNVTIAIAHREARLYQAALLAWRLWFQQKADTRSERNSAYFLASEHRNRCLLSKSVYGLKNGGSCDDKTLALLTRKREVFSAWKVQMRESALLKKYLVECNLSQRRLESPKERSSESGLSTFRSRRSSDSQWEEDEV